MPNRKPFEQFAAARFGLLPCQQFHRKQYFRRWGEFCNRSSSPFADVIAYSRLSSDSSRGGHSRWDAWVGPLRAGLRPWHSSSSSPSDGFMPSLPVHWIGAEHRRQSTKFHFGRSFGP
jgi:hypothetical protein